MNVPLFNRLCNILAQSEPEFFQCAVTILFQQHLGIIDVQIPELREDPYFSLFRIHRQLWHRNLTSKVLTKVRVVRTCTSFDKYMHVLWCHICVSCEEHFRF